MGGEGSKGSPSQIDFLTKRIMNALEVYQNILKSVDRRNANCMESEQIVLSEPLKKEILNECLRYYFSPSMMPRFKPQEDTEGEKK